jgi:GAF domain-containing protein/DNA-binding CsgD family transcriptional regulator
VGSTESRELGARRRQLAAVAEFGLRAMEDVDLPVLMDEAVALVAEILAVEYAKIFALQPDGESLLLCSGVGWAEGVVGQATVGTEPDSRAFFLPAGYSLLSEEEPAIVEEDLRSEGQLSGLPLLREREVRSGITVVIHGWERPFGILGADTSRQRRFTIDDVDFLQAVANVLAATAERRQAAYAGAAGTSRLRFEFLAEASMLLSSSPDCSSTLAGIARLVVPELADCCIVEVLEEGGAIRSAVAHVDPAKEDLLRELQARYPLDPSNTSSNASEVLRTGRSKSLPKNVDMALRYAAEDAEDPKMLLDLHPTSYMCVPLVTRGRILGVIRLASVKPGRHYGSEDLALAESLARFAALAIENARLHLPELELARGLVQLANKCYKISASSDGKGPLALVPRPSLTPRQLEVLELVSEGKSAKEIGQRLCLSEPTIRNHIRSLLQVLGARSQLEAVAQARRTGLLA